MNPGVQPLHDLTFSLVGPGRVGASLAHWLTATGAVLSQVAGRSPESPAQLVDKLGGRVVELSDLVTDGEDLLLVAVPDPALEQVTAALVGRTQAAVVLHTSGSQTAGALEPLAPQGSAIGTLHPLKAFPGILPDPALAAGSVFAFEGDPEARRLACRLVEAWSALIADVPAETRPLYHLAASVAAGGVVTLVATAWEIAHRVGLPDTIGRGYLELAQGALDRVAEAENPAAAITGPVARGDVETLEDQLRRLESLEPEWSHLVASVARETLRQIEKRDGPRASLEELRRLLETVN